MTAPTRAVPARRRPVPEVAPPQPRLRVVPAGELSPRARRRRARAVAFLASIVAAAGLFGLVAFHVVLTQGQLQLDRLQDKAAAEQAQYDRNRLEVAELEAPERIVAVAQERLGMVPPPEVTYLSPTGVTVGDRAARPAPGTPGPATSWPTVKAHLAGRP